MGSNEFYEDERPVRGSQVGDFWIDETPVTNRQFAEFVEETGYVTFAEVAPDPKDYPGILPELTVPGSAVFTPPVRPINLNGPPVWWCFVPGAFWRAPLGPGSSIKGIEDHPVVHVVAADTEAYANWAGKTLPSEAEWEYAARGGLDGAPYTWGAEMEPAGQRMAKIWEGEFPWLNSAPHGLERTAPVRSYPANGYGLFDMIGNVWEWTADWYVSSTPVQRRCCSGIDRREKSMEQGSRIPRRVLKGGSHLCAPNYCRRYRPAARWPQPIDTSTSHVGFRCIIRC